MAPRYAKPGCPALGYLAVNSVDSLSESHQTESLTVSDVLGSPSFAGTQVLAGSEGLDRIVSSVNVMENPDIVPWVKRGELLITVGYSISGSGADLTDLLESLDQKHLAGFAVKLGPYIPEIESDALAFADGRGFPVLALPAHVSFDDLIADVYAARGSLLLGGLYRRRDREQDLMNVALQGGGPAQVAERLSELVGREVLVLGLGNEVVAHHGGTEGRVPAAGLLERSRHENALSAPIVFGSTYVGQLYVFSDNGSGTSLSPGLVPTCAKIMALAASREIAVASVDRQFRTEFLEQLLQNRLDRSEVERRCQALEWSLEFPAVVVSLSPGTLDAAPYLERAQDMMAWFLRSRGLPSPIAIINGEVVAIIGGGDTTDLEAIAEEAAQDVMTRSASSDWSAGVSKPISGPTGLEHGWDEAKVATRVTRKVRGPGFAGRFSELGVFRLLAEVDTDALRQFAGEVLGELADGADGQLELRQTLTVLLDTNMNVAMTARLLHYHYNTIRYRVERLESILGPFMTDPTRRVELHVALLICDMLTEDEPQSS